MRLSLKISLLATLSAVALSGCTLAPKYERGTLPVADQFPMASVSDTSADALPWKSVILDTRLQQVIEQALANNRDLRVAVLNVEQARAQYRIQRSSLVPYVDAGVSGRKGETDGVETESYSADIGITAYELDLFGRVRSLNQSALQSFFASEENSRAARISLIAATATAWLNLAADEELLRLSRETLALREQTLELSVKRFELGATSQLDVSQTRILTEQARADVAGYEALVQQDKNALRLLVGAEVAADLLPTAFPVDAILADLPVGLPSEVLLNRPDVKAAEYDLKARNADIGAARANFFPRITLTGSVGKASTDLGELFDGSDSWSFAPAVSIPIFSGGANLANLGSAKAGRDIALARYEGAIQVAFRDVADELATRATIDQRLEAQTIVAASATDSTALAQARFDQGLDSYLTLIDAQRTQYGAQQSLILVRLTRSANLINLYRALGGGLS